ncbi:DUF1330 domain-containing protein [Bosea sp. Tri-44]|uniref:DUF1330 domain-containing protein n=1 Tax=Bosea sp. Tri-44 TaxID=1972137 RepID=UPI00100EB91E|nr:DUF1330 domain-containing protein [Bosea sp. Tri-44]RXT56952.1 DUF1330 domain-containing protein [Bosea sp. Tri-44]
MSDHTSFSRETFAAFRADDRPGPVQMLNLIRLNAEAQYPAGLHGGGREAFAAYGRISAPVLSRLGGRIIWRGGFEQMLIGPRGERWDICFIAEYPSVEAFAAMFRDPIYREAMVHRQAAVRDCRLIRLESREAGVTFAG